MSAEEGNTAAWDHVLAELESDLTWTEQDHGRSLSPWTPPVGLGPIPEMFADRARVIVEGQRRLVADLAHEQATVTSHLAALRAVPRTTGNGQSAFLDRIA